ncbi:pyruvate dehydrogenase (acetyl-transferring), homodimeric type [Larsenimonas suaedae]|uniref:Pyruvate dehydrogenase E1 component n=1 Tax=Larsenimonas suaedae TaxID=1851019 RepID=A0ABU1GZP1_9GAMM|nr:pyruvate dehydrogenase (acetyl-transferring), homodimeric type [Larsenimonas suaedae]MCM2972793.1 pyruvate dehydrogenase (acetyl-transferring), homodimeric type [Larsenimonas suaedae]MDR5896892.1 pyruvate dehydrogenase (acetyl-transferring), homodimeric type [Larsenimonas suaedae]
MAERYVESGHQEWQEALRSLIHFEGHDEARSVLKMLSEESMRQGGEPTELHSPHRNSIPVAQEPAYPGDLALESRLRAAIRWNSIAMVVRANQYDKSLGGHLASFMSSCTLYEVGFNHFFRAPGPGHGGDLVYFQGHIAPGIYSRSFLEGRLDESTLDRFRQEVGGGGLSSYPHPYLMPEYWQFSTVSMGLGPIQAIYQARLMRYLDHRGITPLEDRKVWAFLGDGECDEVETLGALPLASRERLGHLIFVVNCNLQRLDGPVRGNDRVMDELERTFRGSGWNVIKVVWGSEWDPLFAADHDGALQHCLDTTVDGEYQSFKAQGAVYTRTHFFGKSPTLSERTAALSDEAIAQLKRGGHDPKKIHAAYKRATEGDNGRPTVILAHTVKGYGMGPENGEADMEAHNIKTLSVDGRRALRDRLALPIEDVELEQGMPYYRPAEDAPERHYLMARRTLLGGTLPTRRAARRRLEIPPLTDKAFASQLKGSNERAVSTTMAFVRVLSGLIKHKALGPSLVPIVPDEARTFGMEGLFRQVGIYASEGQKYRPADAGQLMSYREDQRGQILEEGITEAGAMASWIAAATAGANHDATLIPFYIFYAMFGFQRVGDLAWAAGDMLARGFLVGGTAGRTTINGEGLQHQDGHSHLSAAAIPNCRSYDPTYAHEIAVIVQHGLKDMFEHGNERFYYLTVMNETYVHPPMPEGCEEGIIRGMYLLKACAPTDTPIVQLMGSGTLLREAEAAAELLAELGILANVWSVTSFNELRREGLAYDRRRLRTFDASLEAPWVTQQLEVHEGPVIAVTDYLKLYADQIRAWVPGEYYVLGTDGFGRSDTREKLRQFFEVDRFHVAFTAVDALYRRGDISSELLEHARTAFAMVADKPSPLCC